jgi:hypothetical protein
LVALVVAFFASFRNHAALQLEILALRHQLSVLQRSVKRPKMKTADRFLWAWSAAVWEDWQPSFVIMKPATVIGWASACPGPGRFDLESWDDQQSQWTSDP